MHWWPRHTPSTGPVPGEGLDGLVGHAGVLGSTGTGADEHGVGIECHQLGHRKRVVAVHDRFGSELAQVLDEVVDEAVVVVDDQHAGRHEVRRVAPLAPATGIGCGDR